MRTRTMIRLSAAAVGAFFVLLAFFGFASISDDTVVGGGLRGGNDPDMVWGLFSVNTVLNFIHLLFGAITILAGLVINRTRMLAWTMSGFFTALLVYDIVLQLVRTGTDPLAINQADMWLHAFAAVALASLSIVAAQQERSHRTASPTGPTGRSHIHP